MGIKEKMMDAMMNKMSKEEKMEMMDKMMNSFFDGMTNEEKTDMMNKMMPKMMQNMMKGNMGGMGKMMDSFMNRGPEMMKNMMGGSDEPAEDDFSPMDMCKEMMEDMKQGYKLATMATPEIQGLFQDWVEQIETEILDFINNNKDKEINTDEIAANFKISKNSTYYFLTRLAQQDKIKLSIK